MNDQEREDKSEKEIMERFYQEINVMNKDELLKYMMRAQDAKRKHRRKYRRMALKLKVLKEKIIQEENKEWLEQTNYLNNE
jgi:hypothetical protein